MPDNENRKFLGIWIPAELWLSSELSLQEKVFLVEINSLDNENGCYATNDYFSKFFGLSKNRCSEVIKGLESKGLIKIRYTYKPNTKCIDKRFISVVCAPFGVFEKSTAGIRKTDRGIREIDSGYSENREDNNTGTNNIVNKLVLSGQAAKPRKAKAQAAEIPTVEELTARFDNSKLAAVVCSWFEYKQERGDKPYTPMGMKSFLTTVERFVKNKGVRGVCQCIELTMGSGYQGVLWDKCEDTR